MKVLCIGDVHLTEKPPSSCTETYLDDLFDLLEQILQIAIEGEYDAVAFAGDIFHNKAPSRTSHALVIRFIVFLQKFPMPVYIVVGNHDITWDRLDTLSRSPLGAVFASGAAKPLDGPADPEYMELPFYMYGIPWQQKWERFGEVLHKTREITPDDHIIGPDLIICHAPIFPAAKAPPYDYVAAEDVAAEVMEGTHIFYGHIHDDHGIYEIDSTVFCNHGALTRGSLAEYDINREIAVTSWSPDGGFTKIVLDYKPADQVLRIAEAAQATTASDRHDAFIDSIAEADIASTNIEALQAAVREQVQDEGLLTLINELLEGAA